MVDAPFTFGCVPPLSFQRTSFAVSRLTIANLSDVIEFVAEPLLNEPTLFDGKKLANRRAYPSPLAGGEAGVPGQ